LPGSVLAGSLVFRICAGVFEFCSAAVGDSVFYRACRRVFINSLKAEGYLTRFWRPLEPVIRGSALYRLLSFRLDVLRDPDR
jgi:hypothetical protein